MEITGIIPHIEALVFASDKPLTSLELTDLINNAFGFMEDRITLDQVETALSGIIEKYSSEFYPFEVRESGGGWQFLTKKDYHKTVAQINGDKFMKRLSPAALETLSIIAYKQPVTKGEIESIRGVSADYAIQKLLEKELIIISGRNEQLPGHPLVYVTSKTFMDYFGINSADELPRIKEVLADQEILPTPVNGEGDAPFSDATEDAALSLAVGENGELIEQDTDTEETQAENETEARDAAAGSGNEGAASGGEGPESAEDTPIEEEAVQHTSLEDDMQADGDDTNEENEEDEEKPSAE